MITDHSSNWSVNMFLKESVVDGSIYMEVSAYRKATYRATLSP